MRVASGLLLAALAAALPLRAQQPVAPPVDSVAVVAIHLSDGTDLTGRVVALDDSSITLLTFGGARVIMPRRSILSWRAQQGRVTPAGFRQVDPNTTRLFFGPTARTLPQGRAYFADYYLFFPVAGVGVSDRVMFSGGVSIIPGSDQVMYAAAKVGLISSKDSWFALGGFYGAVPGEGSLGLGYAVATLGSQDNAITLMGGMPFTTEEVAHEPLFMVGAEARTGTGSKFMAEIWKIPGADDVPALFGMRWFGQSVAAGFGLVYVFPNSIEGWPFIPWVDFAVNW